MPVSDATSGIQKGLVLAANHFVNKMKQRLDSGNYPKGNAARGNMSIQDSTSIDTPVQQGGVTYIDVKIDLGKAPFAAAFEYGSGLTGRKGQRYPIVPINASILAFMWPEAQNIAPGRPPGTIAQQIVDESGKAFLPGVMHPGIREVPYIRPTLQEEANEIRRILRKEFTAQIRLGGVVTIIS